MNYQFCKNLIYAQTCQNQHCQLNQCCDQKSTAAKIPLSSEPCPYSEFSSLHPSNSISCGSSLEEYTRAAKSIVVFEKTFSLNLESVEGFKESIRKVGEQLGCQKIFIVGLQIVVLSNLNKIECGFCAYLEQLIEEYTELKISRNCWPSQIYMEDNQIQR